MDFDGFCRILTDFVGFWRTGGCEPDLCEHDVFGLYPLPLYPSPPCQRWGKTTLEDRCSAGNLSAPKSHNRDR